MDSTSFEGTNPLFVLVHSILISLSEQADMNNFNIGPTERQLLLPSKIGEVAQKISDAVKVKVAHFLLSGKEFNADKY